MVAGDQQMEIDMTRIFVPDHVENQAAYIRAAEARIVANRCKGNRKRWEQESGVDVVERCCSFLGEYGEFARIQTVDEDGYVTSSQTHPLVKASQGEFFVKMLHSIRDYGRLTPGQERAVLNMIEKAQARVAERAAAQEAKRQTAKHIGTVGERRDFDLVVKFTTSFETQFGLTRVYVMEDAEGNVVVYKGSTNLMAEKGDEVEFKATIKAHDKRDGVAQTIVARPKF